MRGLTVVFDLDGTLVETAPDLVAATNHVLALHGTAPVELAAIRPIISFGSRAMIEHGLKLNGETVSQADLDRLQARFLEFYFDNIAVGSHVFEHVGTALDEIAGAGARLAVCTNKMVGPARELLGKLGLAPRFAAITGWDSFPVRKPDPAHLTGTVRLAGGDLARTIMIGDNETDIATAKAAGVPVIAVTFGYTHEPVATFEPNATIDHYRELVPTIRRIAAAMG
ncbi:MAG TPA: HAD family hydrolase [Hyphomicrobiaceae bacterium]|nr:HAD family hydrolase [Hyphomicrobiaceae bacterium]